MKKIFLVTLLIVGVAPLCHAQAAITAEELLDKIDKNMVFTTAYVEMEMVITIRNRSINKTFTSYAQGNDKSFIEFHSPARDKGTKILKQAGIIKIYYPSAERVMRLSGHMLRRSMMGSDFSYEDMTERATKLREEYSAEITGEEDFNSRPCYTLVLTSKIPKQTYFTRKAWVDKEWFIGMKEELYAKSGKLLKVMVASDVKLLQNRRYPTTITLTDKLRKNSQTVMKMKSIKFDISIDSETFSERRLMKK